MRCAQFGSSNSCRTWGSDPLTLCPCPRCCRPSPPAATAPCHLVQKLGKTGDELSAIVRTVLIHEIAHHFGFTDEEIELLEREADVD